MIQIVDKSKCCGCSACSSICPQNCIKMVKDNEGFFYPYVEVNRCINCHLCEKCCPIFNPKSVIDNKRTVFGAINKDEVSRKASSSGGVFSLLASNIIDKGGTVFGATMSDDCYSVKHVSANTHKAINRLKGSKYVQSDMQDCFCNVRGLLESGQMVLFTGTPCQVAGLKSCLNKEYDNLITQDIVCHGTPSQTVWERYLKEKELQYEAKAQEVSFRHKIIGEKTYFLSILFDNGLEYCASRFEDLYLRGYLSNCYLKPACYDCKYKGLDRISDITLADLWGADKYVENIKNDFGISLVILHSEKGHSLFEEIKDNLQYEQIDDKAIDDNRCAIESSNKPINRSDFWNEFSSNENANIMEKYFGITIREKIKWRIKK